MVSPGKVCPLIAPTLCYNNESIAFLFEDLPAGIGSPMGGGARTRRRPADAETDDNFVKLEPKRPNIHASFLVVK